MRPARNRLLALVLLFLVGLGAVTAAAYLTTSGGWLIPTAYLLGGLLGWITFGAAAIYAQTKRQHAAARIARKADPDKVAALKKWLDDQSEQLKKEGQK